MSPPEFTTIKELKALGRKRIIELALEVAKEVGSTMVPSSDTGVKVLGNDKMIRVELARGFRAYTDNGIRTITSITLTVNFDPSPSTSYEGDDLMTKEDERILSFVLKKMPPNYEYLELTIGDDPSADSYDVSLDGEYALGRHSVDKKTGEWTYITHKHYAHQDDGPMALKEWMP